MTDELSTGDYLYSAFGMTIRSEIDLGLRPASSAARRTSPDLTVRFGNRLFRPTKSYDLKGVQYGVDGDSIHIRVPGVADFVGTPEGELSVHKIADSSQSDIAIVLGTLVLGMVLHTRTTALTLHGSAVSVDGGALLFLGDCGVGKSTLAGAMAAKGFPLLSDDMIVISSDDTLLATVPTVRLEADSFSVIFGGTEDALPRKDRKFEARLGSGDDNVLADALFILEPSNGDDIAIVPIRGMLKVKSIVPHVQALEGVDDRAAIFNRATRWMASIPVFLVRRPAGEFRLDKLCGAVVDASAGAGTLSKEV